MLASVTTGLESIARDEIAERIGSAATADASIRPGSLKLTVEHEALPALHTLRCPGQLTLLVQEDVAFFAGRKDAVNMDLDKLRKLGDSIDWPAALLLRSTLLGRRQQPRPQQEPVRFRVTCKRTTAVDGRDIGVQHGFSSVGAAAQLGGAIAQAMAGSWIVSLKEFDLDIAMSIAGRELTLGLKAAAGAAATAGSGSDSRARTARAGSAAGLMLGRTSLKVALAHAMSRLALGSEGGEGGGAAGLTLDPMCGSGCLGLEAVSYWPGVVALGGDVEPKEMRRLGRSLATLRNAGSSGAGSSGAGKREEEDQEEAEGGVGASHRCDAALWDAARLPLRTGVVDSIATDLPWGQTVGTREQNRQLYPAALREFGRVLRPGGMCVLMTADRKAMHTALRGQQQQQQQQQKTKGQQQHQQQGRQQAAWVAACFERQAAAPPQTELTPAAPAAAIAAAIPTPILEVQSEPAPEPEPVELLERSVGGGNVIQLRAHSSDELAYKEIYEPLGAGCGGGETPSLRAIIY